MKLKDKVVVVTGAGSGMGRELTWALLAHGAKVAAFDVNAKTLAETASQASNVNLFTKTLDITNREDVEALPAAIIERFGTIDCVINNAGIIQPFIDVKDLDYAVIDRVFNVNWRGTLYMTKSFLPHLLKRPEAHLVNVSSMGGFMPFPGQAAYGASKAAVKLLTESLYAELRGTHVHVSVVFPGAIHTNIMINSGMTQPEGAAESAAKLMLPADVAARRIIEGIERDTLHIYVGKDSKALNALYRLMPRSAINLITTQMKKMLTTANAT
jgi:short-subunit dehydrogenase